MLLLKSYGASLSIGYVKNVGVTGFFRSIFKIIINENVSGIFYLYVRLTLWNCYVWQYGTSFKKIRKKNTTLVKQSTKIQNKRKHLYLYS